MNTTVIVLIIGFVILIAIGIAILVKSGKPSAGEVVFDTEKIEKEIRDLRTETTNNINNTIGNFGKMISENQKQAAEVQNQNLEQLNKQFHQLAIENEQKLENIRQTMEDKISALTKENNLQLEKMRDTVDEKLQKTLEDRIGQSFKLVNERLEQVYIGLGEMKNLAEDVGDLKNVLSNVKNRGVFGEMQLASILEEMLIPEQYDTNVATIPGSSERVEFAIKLPNEGGDYTYLPIDSKFPGDIYNKLVDAYEEGDLKKIESAKKELATRIKAEAKDISTKYIQPPYTTQYAIMFLPFEGLYAEVLRLNIANDLQKDYKVTVAGPTTISALLNSLQMGFKTLSIQKHSHEVWKVLGDVKKEFSTFEKILTDIQKRLQTTDKDLDKLIGTRTRAINRKLRDVEVMSLEESGPGQLENEIPQIENPED